MTVSSKLNLKNRNIQVTCECDKSDLLLYKPKPWMLYELNHDSMCVWSRCPLYRILESMVEQLNGE